MWSNDMPRPSQRSTSFVKKKVKTPSGRAVVHYLKKKPACARCSLCRRPLSGVPSRLPKEMRRIPKTKKRPERPFGGSLCSVCTKNVMKEKNLARWKND